MSCSVFTEMVVYFSHSAKIMHFLAHVYPKAPTKLVNFVFLAFANMVNGWL